MPTHNGQPVTQRGGAGAGRGDDAHGVTPPAAGFTRVNAVSAATRKAAPLTKEDHEALRAEGASPAAAYGSKTSYDVSNAGSHDPGEGMGMVRSHYRAQRQAGMSPDQARFSATIPSNYSAGNGPGGRMGPSIKQATDYKGDAV